MADRIFFMDEELVLRDLAKKSLLLDGFEILTFANGEELLEKFRKDIPPHVVVLDLNVDRGMGAKETIEALREIGYEGKAIVSSGYIFEGEKVEGFDGALPKPYWPKDLKNAIKEVLKEKAGA